MLRPTFFTDDAPWPGRRKLVASHVGVAVDRHTSPTLDCACGIYACSRESYMLAAWATMLAESPIVSDAIPVYGQVSLWGIIKEHEEGWRAQYAYPYSLRIPGEIPENIGVRAYFGPEFDAYREAYDPQDFAHRLRERYGVDVEVRLPGPRLHRPK